MIPDKILMVSDLDYESDWADDSDHNLARGNLHFQLQDDFTPPRMSTGNAEIP